MVNDSASGQQTQVTTRGGRTRFAFVVYLRLKGHWGEWEPLHPQWQHWGADWLTQDLSSPWVWWTTGVVVVVVVLEEVDGDISG